MRAAAVVRHVEARLSSDVEEGQAEAAATADIKKNMVLLVAAI